MKELYETRFLMYSAGLILSSSIERIITNIIEKKLNLIENNPLLYHFLSIILLIFFFILANIGIKILINSEYVSRAVFKKKYVGGHWVEIVYREKDNKATHYCDLEIRYDIDKIYLSGTDYDTNYEFMYNLETESATMENYGLSYIYKCIGGNENRKGYGTLAFHKKTSSSPDRYTGKYKGDDNEQYRVEGFLLNDDKILKALNMNFISTFDTIIKEKKQFLFETERKGQKKVDCMYFSKKIENAVSYIHTKTSSIPKIGLVLGSGLGDFTGRLDDAIFVTFREIPDFPLSTVEGHEGAFVFGNYEGIPIVALQGRLHYYEGYSQQEITIPIRIMKKLSVETLILTNAAGGINLDFSVGTLMLIVDHINYSGGNPLIGPNFDEFGLRFPDVSDVYTKELRIKLKEEALREGIKIKEGIYIMYSGPNYETPAEIRFFRTIGADAVGMSTVPEALIASHCGMKIIGISCITNMASGILEQKLEHHEVMEMANKVKPEFTKLLDLAIKNAR